MSLYLLGYCGSKHVYVVDGLPLMGSFIIILFLFNQAYYLFQSCNYRDLHSI